MEFIKKLKNLGKNISILYVEDDSATRQSVVTYLEIIFGFVGVASDGITGLNEYKKRTYDIVMSDILMPNMNGLEMAKEIKKNNPKQEILFITAFSETKYLMEAIYLNASGYIIKPINYDMLNESLYKVVQKIYIFHKQKKYKKNLELMVKKRTDENIILEREKITNYEHTLVSLVELVEKRDTYTGGHSLRVAKYCKLIAQKMGYHEKDCDLLYRAGVLHDIGKIETPDAVLLKPGKLDKLEYSLIKQHVTTGEDLLSKIPMYKELSKIMGSHHERYDGGGYPRGLKKDEIPELSRVMIIADAFDAMTTNRIYKPGVSREDAIQQIHSFSGTQFDPNVVKFAVDVFKNIKIDTAIFQLPSTKMEEKRFAFFFEDSHVGCFNHTYLDLVLVQNRINNKEKYLSVFFIHNFGAYNLKYSWEQGDILLKNVVKILKVYYPLAQIFRLHGDDFIIIDNKNKKIDLAIFDKLLDECNNIIQIQTVSFSIHHQQINSLAILEELLKNI